MNEKGAEDDKKDKMQKLVRVLKDLEDKYKRVSRDRTGLLQFLQSVLPAKYHTNLRFDIPPGDFEDKNLASVYSREILTWIEDAKIAAQADLAREVAELRTKCETLEKDNLAHKGAEAALMLRLGEAETKLRQTEAAMAKQAQERAKTTGTLLLAKLKSATINSRCSAQATQDLGHDYSSAQPQSKPTPTLLLESRKTLSKDTQTEDVWQGFVCMSVISETMLGGSKNLRTEYKILEDEYTVRLGMYNEP